MKAMVLEGVVLAALLLVLVSACNPQDSTRGTCECDASEVCIEGACRVSCAETGARVDPTETCVAVGAARFCAERVAGPARLQPAAEGWQESRSPRFVVRGATAPWATTGKGRAGTTLNPGSE